MIDATIDGKAIDPGQLEMHQQDDPFPGGSGYALCIVDPELAEVVAGSLPPPMRKALTPLQTVSLFNLLRPYVSLKLGRRKPLFWANTVEEIKVTNNSVELCGVCSQHIN